MSRYCPFKRMALHDYLPSLLGDGDTYSEIVYSEGKNIFESLSLNVQDEPNEPTNSFFKF